MTHLVRIGNSQGIRIPKAIIEQAHLEGRELKLQIVKNGLLVSPKKLPRKGWQESIEASIKAHGNGPPDNEWLDANLTSDDELE